MEPKAQIDANKGRAAFLDRDGTIIFDKYHLFEPEKVELIPGAYEAVHLLLKEGFKLFLFTNQSGVGRGYFTLEDVGKCNTRMLELLDLPQDAFAASCISTTTSDDDKAGRGGLRKPNPQFIFDSIKRFDLQPEHCFMAGDRILDWQAGANAGIRAYALKTGEAFAEEELRFIDSARIEVCDNLLDAAIRMTDFLKGFRP